jgi:hypothetical protein
MAIPQAHIVRTGGHLITPPPRAPEPSKLVELARNAVAVAIGLWPLTAVMLLMVGLIIMAANGGRH